MYLQLVNEGLINCWKSYLGLLKIVVFILKTSVFCFLCGLYVIATTT